MLTIAAAFDRLLATVTPANPVTLPLADSLGLSLAADVRATNDSPPFDKALMDGYAVLSSDLAQGTATLEVVELVTAGMVPKNSVSQGKAIQIMTGTPIPSGADLVVKVEECQRQAERVHISTKSTTAGTHLLKRGASVKEGQVVLRAGTSLNGSRIGALAELGSGQIQVYPRPFVAILATGDELVAVEQQPGPGQIRNSNEAMLVAQIQASGAIPMPLGVARDHRDDLRRKINQGLSCDVLVMSGGVSAGLLDLVPSELAAAGVEEVFHQVEMKPGKPVWFGVRREPRPCYVFGLPGNPVSSLVCCELFVRTALRQLMGSPSPKPQSIPASLEHDYSARADRPVYHPSRLTWSEQGPRVTLVPWHGSSDLCGTVQANAMCFLPGTARQYQEGDLLQTILW